jgi:cytidylate kinase
MRKVIAIDGPAAAGKGTIARFIAKELSFTYIDSGLFYRYVAMFKLSKYDIHDMLASDSFFDTIFDYCKTERDENNIVRLLKSEACALAASHVSKDPAVRKFVTSAIVAYKDDIVIDGRDTTTVMFPDADVKLFVTASPEIRAERRRREMDDQEDILQSYINKITDRDKNDTTRSVSPLVQAQDAILIDTSNMNIQQAREFALSIVKKQLTM